MKRRIAIVGAGWSGLACALQLSRHDCHIDLFDAAPQVGGRARGVEVALGAERLLLDNGQHLLLGAYTETLRLMRNVGVDLDVALLRLPFELRYPDGFCLRAWRLGAPWHLALGLLAARGMDWRARRHAMHWVQQWRRRKWQLENDAPAHSLFATAPASLRKRLWRPLCLAALNVELEQASGQVLLNILRDSIGAERAASDLLIPRRDLSQIFAGPAQIALRERGAEIHLRTPVQHLSRADAGAGWILSCRDKVLRADAVVLALPPARAAALLDLLDHADLRATVAALHAIAMAPIATVYLRYGGATRLPRPALALLDDPEAHCYGQWVFDRGWFDAAHAGVMGVVISAAAHVAAHESAALAGAVAAQLTDDLGLPAPGASAVIVEKRATIVPAPNVLRPAARLPLPGLFLAGDAAASDYPSTLEGSVRAGIAAAQAVVADGLGSA